jgi:DNA modification methylase
MAAPPTSIPPSRSGIRQPYWHDDTTVLYQGDATETLAEMPAQTIDCVVTSPPYWGLRDYGVHGQYGCEPSPEEYLGRLRATAAEIRRVLADDGTLWLNLGDRFGAGGGNDQQGGLGRIAGALSERPGLPNAAKSLVGLPWQLAFGLKEDGWILRNAVVWHKPNGMPQSVRDRLSCRYELIFLLVQQDHYYFDLDPIREPALCRPHEPRGASSPIRRHARVHPNGKNPGDLWAIPTQPSRLPHHAAFPVEIPRRCIAAGCRPGGTVLDPFAGTATTGIAARQLGRRFVGIDLNPVYCGIAADRLGAGSEGHDTK